MAKLTNRQVFNVAGLVLVGSTALLLVIFLPAARAFSELGLGLGAAAILCGLSLRRLYLHPPKM